MVFYHQKFREIKTFKQISVSTNKIHEGDSLGALNHSTKGAMTDCFRKEYFP